MDKRYKKMTYRLIDYWFYFNWKKTCLSSVIFSVHVFLFCFIFFVISLSFVETCRKYYIAYFAITNIQTITQSMFIEAIQPCRIRATLKPCCFNFQSQSPVLGTLCILPPWLHFSGKSHHKQFLHSVKTEQLKSLIMGIFIPSSIPPPPPSPLFSCSTGGIKARICLFLPSWANLGCVGKAILHVIFHLRNC